MSRIRITVAIALFVATPVVAQERDKVLHAEAGFVIAAMCDSVELNPVTCGLVAGLAKEAYDSTGRGNVESADVAATVLGALLYRYGRIEFKW